MLLPFTLAKKISNKKKESKIILFEGGVSAYTFLRLLYILLYIYMCMCVFEESQAGSYYDFFVRRP